MTSIWVTSLARNLDAALDLLGAAIQECPDGLWGSGMWDVPADLFGPEPPGPRGRPVTDLSERKALVQRRSTPWSVAWHALEVLDYDLTGEFGPWAPPPPFAGHPHWMLTALPEPWTRSDLLGYVGYCRQRVAHTLAGMTEEKAATPLPTAHRYGGEPYAWLVTATLGHTIEHASQIRQFITGAGRASPEVR